MPGETRERRLQRQAGDARAISKRALQVVVVPHHGVVAVDVPAPEELHLLAAVDHLPVGEVGALGFVAATPRAGSRLSGSGRPVCL